MKRIASILPLIGLLAGATAPAVRADLVTCRSGAGCLNGSTSFDWSEAGSPFEIIPTGTIVSSNNGLLATVNLPGGAWVPVAEGSEFYGNFTAGDQLLWTAGNGPLTLSFNNVVSGVGTNIQADSYGNFTALVQGFNSAGQLLDSQSITGNSNGQNDGSAVFLGLANDPGLSTVTFSLTSSTGDDQDFAIDDLDVSLASVSAAVAPEPESYFLLEAMFLIIFAVILVRRKARAS